MAFPTIYSQNVLTIQRFANALYNMQVGSTTLNQVMSDAAALGGYDEAFNIYFNFTHGAQSNNMVAETLLANFGIVAGQNGLDLVEVGYARDYIVGALAAVPADERGAAISDIIDAFVSLAADVNYGAAVTAWNAEVAGAVGYTGTADMDAGTPYIVRAPFLTAGPDEWSGTNGNDTVTSDVVQNQNGAQVNTLGTGDYLDGFGGIDTLQAQVTEGVFSGGGNAPIMPRTFGIENIKLEAIFSNIGFEALDLNLTSLIEDGLDLAGMPQGFIPVANDTDVYFSAKNMRGIDFIGSDHSDADLTVMDLTVDADELTSSMTIGMAYTGNSDHVWNESDFRVYFDEDDLLAGQTVTESQAFYWLLDEDGHDATVGTANYQPLQKIDREGILFSMNGEPINIIIGQLTGNDYTTAKTWQAYRDLLEAERVALVAESATDPAYAKYAALATVDITVSNAPGHITTTNTDTLLNVPVWAIVLTDNAGGVFSDLGYQRDPGATGEFDVFGRFGFDPSEDVDLLISVNVELEKVGRGGDGGELVIGGMDKGADNVWGEGSSTKPAGVEQFDVTVLGGDALPNSLSALKSTNNALQVVNVVSEAGFAVGEAADLRIGNSNTTGILGTLAGNANALKDVQIFNAASFNGDLTVYAGLTDEIVPKYLDLQDDQLDPAADNVDFVYTLGNGNDFLNMVISDSTFATQGTTTREDFMLHINGGAGNDTIETLIGTGAGTELTEWYVNSHFNNTNPTPDVAPKGYLNIDAGAGDDTVRTAGAGDFVIKLGAGNDTVYTENTGVKAQWAFNTNGLVLTTSDANNSYAAISVDGVDANTTATFTVRVTYKGLVSNVAVELPTVASNASITDLQMNQLVKNAINNDAVLNKLLTAFDGPANILYVDSLITENDALDANSLVIDVINEAGVTTNWSNAADPATYDTTYVANGQDANASDNQITPGLGNDVVVLGTYAGDHDNVIYDAVASGNDVIVNFVATVAPVAAVAGVSEVATLTFAAGPEAGADTFFTINNVAAAAVVTAPLAAGTTADQAATAVALAINGAAGTLYTAGVAGAVVTLTANATGVQTDVTATAAGTVDITVASAVTTQGVTAVAAVPASVGDDTLDFTALTGAAGTFVGAAFSAIDGSITVIAEVAGNDTAAEIKALFDGDAAEDATSSQHIFVAVDGGNVGSAWLINDGAALEDSTVTLIGNIDLADTNWFNLAQANFA